MSVKRDRRLIKKRSAKNAKLPRNIHNTLKMIEMDKFTPDKSRPCFVSLQDHPHKTYSTMSDNKENSKTPLRSQFVLFR